MLRWAIFFCTLSLVAAVFGFSGVSIAAAGVARPLFYLFVIILVVIVVAWLVAG